MYGVEAQQTGLGGLAAQAPPDVYFPQALAVHSGTSGLTGAPPITGVGVPYNAANDVQGVTGIQSAPMAGSVSPSGTAVRIPTGQMQAHWSSILDFHNSPAPWILLAILVLYGWLHASARIRAGRSSASVVL